MAEIYIEAGSGIVVSVPAATRLPEALYLRPQTGGIFRPEEKEIADAKPPSKSDLIDQAKALGIEVKSKMTKAQIAKLIDKHAAKAAEASEAAREKVPRGVAPGTPTEAD